jgi:cobalt-zinc-cadmium efflux system outer membrane protein
MRFHLLGLLLVAGCGSAPTSSAFQRSLRVRAAALASPSRAGSDAPPATREGFTHAVIARDPGMAARVERAREAFERAGVESSLPSPEASAQVWNVPFSQPWSFGDADMYMIELRQRLPAPGLLGAREREGVAMAGAALAELATRERELARRVASAWAEHLAAARHHRVHHAHLAVVDRMADAARARIAASRGPLDDVPRLDAERARVLRLIARFDNDRRRAARTLNVLAGREVDAPLALPDDAPTETVALALPELLGRAVARRGAVVAARASLEAAREGATAAHAEATRPEFMVGLSAWFDPDHHNGYGATAGMTLPWLWGPGQARARAATARVRAEESGVREAESAVRAEVVDAHARVEGALRELTIVQGDAARAAERSLDAAQAGYVTGGTTLLAWLDAARMRLDLAMEAIDLRVELDRSLAALDEAVGEALPRVAAEGGAP